MKNYLLLIMVLLPLAAFGQYDDVYYNQQRNHSFISDNNRRVSFGIGISTTKLDVGSASSVGFVLDMDLYGFHFDIGSNLAQGKGEYLDFSSYKTTQADKQSWLSFNVGYKIHLKSDWFLVPKVGFVSIYDIWEDPIGWDTYYEERDKTDIQFGFDIKKHFDMYYFKAGGATTQLFSCAFGVSF